MAKVTPPGKVAAFKAAANPGGVPGSFSQETVEGAYNSNFVGGDSFMGTPNFFSGLSSSGTRAREQGVIATAIDPYDENGNFDLESYLAQQEERDQALVAQGLSKATTAEQWYDPVQQDSDVYTDPSREWNENFVHVPQTVAGLTDIPTSTTNYARPRTVAAGWAPVRDPEGNIQNHLVGTLTVVFRDGTLWNYYEVPRSVWIKFHNSISKGRSFLNPANRSNPNRGTLLAYANGPADVSSIDESIRQAVYTAARVKQIYYRNPKTGPAHYQYVYKKQPDGSIKRTRVKTYGSSQGPYTGNTNPATNRKIAQAEAAARAAKAKAGSAPKRNTSASRKTK